MKRCALPRATTATLLLSCASIYAPVCGQTKTEEPAVKAVAVPRLANVRSEDRVAIQTAAMATMRSRCERLMKLRQSHRVKGFVAVGRELVSACRLIMVQLGILADLNAVVIAPSATDRLADQATVRHLMVWRGFAVGSAQKDRPVMGRCRGDFGGKPERRVRAVGFSAESRWIFPL